MLGGEEMTLLASLDAAFRRGAEEIIARFLQVGTPAMKNRARRAGRLPARSRATESVPWVMGFVGAHVPSHGEAASLLM